MVDKFGAIIEVKYSINKSLDNLSFIFLITFCFFIGFSDAFALNPIVSIPLVCAMFIAIFEMMRWFFSKRQKISITSNLVFLLFGCIAFILISLFSLYVNTPSELEFRHLLGFAFTIIFYLFFVSSSLDYHFNSQEKQELIFSSLYYGLLTTVFYLVYEFIGMNFLSGIVELPRGTINDKYEPIAIMFIRARSVAAESGHFAMYGVTVGLLCFFYYESQKIRIKRNISIVLIFIILFLTFSVSGIMFFLLTIIFIFLIKFKLKNIIKSTVYSLTVLIVVLAIVLNEYVSTLITSKFASRSFDDRFTKFQESFELFINSDILNYFIGLGPGFYESYKVGAPISLPLTIIFSFGVLGAVIFYGLLSTLFIRSVRIFKANDSLIALGVNASFVFSFLMYLGISNFWYPWMWFVLAISISLHKFPALGSNYEK